MVNNHYESWLLVNHFWFSITFQAYSSSICKVTDKMADSQACGSVNALVWSLFALCAEKSLNHWSENQFSLQDQQRCLLRTQHTSCQRSGRWWRARPMWLSRWTPTLSLQEMHTWYLRFTVYWTLLLTHTHIFYDNMWHEVPSKNNQYIRLEKPSWYSKVKQFTQVLILVKTIPLLFITI